MRTTRKPQVANQLAWIVCVSAGWIACLATSLDAQAVVSNPSNPLRSQMTAEPMSVELAAPKPLPTKRTASKTRSASTSTAALPAPASPPPAPPTDARPRAAARDQTTATSAGSAQRTSPESHVPVDSRPAETVTPSAEKNDVEPNGPSVMAPPRSSEPAKTLTPDRINELAKAARESTLSEEIKADLAKRYQNAIEALQGEEDARRKIAQFEQEVLEGAVRIEQTRQALAVPTAEIPSKSYDDKPLRELETLLDDAKGRLTATTTKLTERDAELKNRSERKAELNKKTEETRARLEQVEQELALPPAADEVPAVVTARHTEQEARQALFRAQAELYQSELRRGDKLTELFPLLRDLAKREQNQAEKEVAQLSALVDRARKIESERQAVEARRQANLADPAIRDLAERNATLAEKRQRIAEKISAISAESQGIKQQLTTLNNDFQRSKDKVDKAGHSSIVGLMLRRQHDNLPSLRGSELRLRKLEQETPVVSLERLEFEDERTMLGDIDSFRDLIMAKMDPAMDRLRREEMKVTVAELWSTRRDLLDNLTKELDAYLFSLSELEADSRELIKRADDFRAFIDEHVLWIRSADPLRLSHLTQSVHAARTLGRPDAWIKLIQASGIDTLRQPLMAAGVVLAALLLLGFRSKLRQRIRALCESRVNSLGWTFLPAIRALLLTAIITSQGPLVVWYLGWRMTSAESSSALGIALGPALCYAALLTWFSSFLRAICRQGSVAETFFDWPHSSLRLARRALRRLTWIGVPLAALVIVTQNLDSAELTNTLGRVSFILVMLVLILFVNATLGKHENVFREAIAKDPQGWLNHMRWVAHATGVTVPTFLSLLAGVGYYFSAQQLAIRLQATFIMSLFVLLVHAIVSRWFVVKRKRLALQQTRGRQQQQQANSENTEGNPSALAAQIKEETDWAAVHERLRLLLRHAVTVGVLVGTWFIWSDVLPALKILDRVQLWSTTTEVPETYEGPDGNLVRTTRLQIEPTTLRHCLIAAVSLFAAFILGKNLPALLEITLLNRLPLDRGGRHAVCIVIHYGVALTGLVIAFRTLHINWGSIQWLAAGMTVGLGFGLQEIFANFVSGMILLFERPIRVGDVVTLGDVSGVVTDIRIRATTITDWDRKELIVPNKDLVTGRLLNWTLTDTTNRVVIRVGLSYDTDAARARQILYATVAAHPNVLSDPAPVVALESFGDSALDFVVRAYLSTLDVRSETIHQLHVSLHEQLRKAGIEIAFPQRDLNIRHIQVPTELNPAAVILPPRRADAA